MIPRRLRAATAVLLCGVLAFWMAACNSAQPAAPADPAPRATETDPRKDEARNVAEASLGKQAEALAYGDLAQNGQEQVLAAVRFLKATPAGEAPSLIFVVRAAVLQETDGKWSQVLLCDEHLKNPKGYLGGTHATVAGGWQLEYRRDPQAGLVMKFTPADNYSPANGNSEHAIEDGLGTFEVRWNKSAKRYQLFEQSQGRYLSEVPSLETPESILK